VAGNRSVSRTVLQKNTFKKEVEVLEER